MEEKTISADNSYIISDDVIQSIVNKAACDTPGVADLADRTGESGGILKKDLFVKAVKAQRTDEGFLIEVGLELLKGSRVEEVAPQVQKNIKEALESMVVCPVKRVDVYLYGVAESR